MSAVPFDEIRVSISPDVTGDLRATFYEKGREMFWIRIDGGLEVIRSGGAIRLSGIKGTSKYTVTAE